MREAAVAGRRALAGATFRGARGATVLETCVCVALQRVCVADFACKLAYIL